MLLERIPKEHAKNMLPFVNYSSMEAFFYVSTGGQHKPREDQEQLPALGLTWKAAAVERLMLSCLLCTLFLSVFLFRINASTYIVKTDTEEKTEVSCHQ